jgi:hypothetical protein
VAGIAGAYRVNQEKPRESLACQICDKQIQLLWRAGARAVLGPQRPQKPSADMSNLKVLKHWSMLRAEDGRAPAFPSS